jgi:hypothetical protein
VWSPIAVLAESITLPCLYVYRSSKVATLTGTEYDQRETEQFVHCRLNITRVVDANTGVATEIAFTPMRLASTSVPDNSKPTMVRLDYSKKKTLLESLAKGLKIGADQERRHEDTIVDLFHEGPISLGLLSIEKGNRKRMVFDVGSVRYALMPHDAEDLIALLKRMSSAGIRRGCIAFAPFP